MNEIEIISDGEDFARLISVLHTNDLYESINNVLDVGAGQGTSIFKGHFKNYIAIEQDKELANSINKKLDILEGKHSVFGIDFFDFNTKEMFDLILLNNFITVLPMPKVVRCLKKCFEMLNDGGVLFVRANSNYHSDIKKAREESDTEEYQEYKFKLKDESYFKNYFKKEELVNLITSIGFKIRVVRREDEEFEGQELFKSEFLILSMKTSD